MNDRTTAEALRIAAERLNRLGWKYSAAKIGEYAAQILNAFDKARKEPAND